MCVERGISRCPRLGHGLLPSPVQRQLEGGRVGGCAVARAAGWVERFCAVCAVGVCARQLPPLHPAAFGEARALSVAIRGTARNGLSGWDRAEPGGCHRERHEAERLVGLCRSGKLGLSEDAEQSVFQEWSCGDSGSSVLWQSCAGVGSAKYSLAHPSCASSVP